MAEVVWMRARKPEPLHSGDVPDRPHKIGEIMLAIEVRVHGLTQQHDLGDSRRDDSLRLAEHLRKAATALPPARRRYDAVGTSVIAAPLDGYPCFDALEAARREILVVLLEVEIGGGRPHTSPGTFDERRKIPIPVWPDHQAHVLRPIEEL